MAPGARLAVGAPPRYAFGMADDPTLHFEPFLYLAGLTHDDALIAWGGFWFRRPPADDEGGHWSIVEDADLERRTGDDRNDSIGARSAPYGHARVEVLDAGGRTVAEATTDEVNHAWVRGLQPDTDYRYRVTVDGDEWAAGPTRRCEPDDGRFRLVEGRPYDNRFRTFPAPDVRAPVAFAVLGDYGVGILASGGRGSRQHGVARAVERAVDHHDVRLVVTTGDNVYIGDEDTAAGSGREDDDWYFSFYEPYRHVINRVPIYPAVGNHDSDDTEASDDRGQLQDNLFTDERFTREAEAGRASVDPGLYYRVSVGADVDLISVDTTLASDHDEHEQFFEIPGHLSFLEDVFPPSDGTSDGDGPRWRIPFSHHPPFCAGPSHANMERMIETVVPLYERAGVALALSGHEHNFQLNRRNGVTYVVSGAGGKSDYETPGGFEEAHTEAWAPGAHFLLVTVDGDELTLVPVTEVADDGALTPLDLRTPDGSTFATPIRLGGRA